MAASTHFVNKYEIIVLLPTTDYRRPTSLRIESPFLGMASNHRGSWSSLDMPSSGTISSSSTTTDPLSGLCFSVMPFWLLQHLPSHQIRTSFPATAHLWSTWPFIPQRDSSLPSQSSPCPTPVPLSLTSLCCVACTAGSSFWITLYMCFQPWFHKIGLGCYLESPKITVAYTKHRCIFFSPRKEVQGWAVHAESCCSSHVSIPPSSGHRLHPPSCLKVTLFYTEEEGEEEHVQDASTASESASTKGFSQEPHNHFHCCLVGDSSLLG